MLAGCSSSTLLSPRHRLRSESTSPAQFQACHFQLPSMSTQRLDLPCTFSRKESSRSQSIRPVGVGLSDKSLESKAATCSLKQNIRLPPLATSNQSVKEEFWQKGKSLKRFAEQGSVDDESYTNRAKRKRGGSDGDSCEGGDSLSLGQLGSGNFWFQSGFEVSRGLNTSQAPFSLTYSGDEDKVCFVPSELITPPLPLSNNPWVESVVREITDLGEKDGESSQRPVIKEASGSSASSESHSLGLRLSENITEHEVGNGSRFARPYGGATEEAAVENQQEEYQAYELVSLLTACVEAIGLRNMAVINHCIAKLGDLSSPKGTAVSRLIAYYTEALALRVTRLWPHLFHITTPREFDRVDDDSGIAFRLLNQVTPIPKFIHFTENEMLLRAFEGKDKVHIIDFDIKQGLQWPGLFQSLASRTNPPSHVRITGIGDSKQELNDTGDRLAGFAEALNLPFEFHPVVDRLEDVRLWMLHVKEGESVAVNCVFQMHKTLYDTSGGALRDFLGLIRSTNPVIVLMAEQEAEHNVLNLEARVCNSLKYYSAIFDSIDSSLPLDSPVRIKIEEMFAREIRNIVACEGSDRLERHEGFEKWRKMMEQGGFRCIRVSEREFLQSRMLLKMYASEDYSVTQMQDGSALTLSWSDQPLYTISSWAPVDIAGSSSSFSQPS
ncbi:scarecrow-like protein 28 [Mercurialis annua]|uniref:scarecrow-like protein 28 n=1 Tax=Mercurialis annua TaxID=3986 RepID=UPI0021601482|nr:scarecrow-like protein 28 [Mercurialis annua]